MSASTNAIVRKSYIQLRGLNLGREFVTANQLQPGQKYSLVIAGLSDGEAEGTLDKSGFVGGMSKLYHAYALQEGDKVAVSFANGVLTLVAPEGRRINNQPQPAQTHPGSGAKSVFAAKNLRHLHLEPFAPGNLSRWTPQTEPDVYMVFGVLAEYTDYRYCCGASKELLTRLGYSAATKPDAVLIDDATSEYLMAEFKVRSSDFELNHKQEDVDVLVCWIDDKEDKSGLPPRVLALKGLLEDLIREGDIDL